MPNVIIAWGPQFANELEINDQATYIAATHGLFNGPSKDIALTNGPWSAPYVTNTKLKERVFSVSVTIRYQPWSADYNAALNDLKRALYNGPFRLIVVRAGIGSGFQYLDCELEDLEGEAGDSTFTIKATAADPVFTDLDGVHTFPDPDLYPDGGDTGPGPSYNPINLPTYVGTAPAEPVITMKVNGGGNVFQYYRDITVYNPNKTFTFNYYPVCIDMGDCRAMVTAGKLHEIGTWYADNDLPVPNGVDTHWIKDIRLESTGGVRKQIFIRDLGDRGSAWHSGIKVWTVIYSLAPLETKTLRLMYGNVDADPTEVFPEASTVRPMFNMYTSTNTAWSYSDFQPAPSNPQSRAMQWTPYLPGADNIGWISYPHPMFNTPIAGGDGGIPGAGGRVLYYRPCSGASGLQFNSPVRIASLSWNHKTSTNAKAPLVLRSQRSDGRYVDDWSDATDKSALLYLYQAAASGAVVCYLKDAAGNRTLTRGGATFAPGDNVMITLDNGTVHKTTVAAINTAAWYITLTVALPSGASAGNQVQMYRYASGSFTYPASDQPKTVAFILRGDYPNLNSGDWFVGAAEDCTVNLNSTEVASVLAFASATEVQLFASGNYQLKGRFGNTATGEYLWVNTVLSLFDKLIVDCEARKVWYVKYNPAVTGSYEEPVSRFEALQFRAVRKWWIHIDPALLTNNISFVVDTSDGGTNFRNLHVQVAYKTKYF